MIDFGLDEEQRLLADTARDFARSHIRPRLRECERAGEVPSDLRARFASLGLDGIDVPEALGGAGLSQVSAALVREELAWGDPGVALALARREPFVTALLELGDEAQRARWMAAPDGACALGGRVLARREDGGYRLGGRAPFALGAAPLLVLADIEGEGPGGFVVTDARPVARRDLLGLRAAAFTEMDVDGCLVPEADRLRGGGDPAAALGRVAARQALAQAARQVGLGHAACEHALEYAEQRRAFGKPIAHFQAIAFLLADIHMEIESARGLLWLAASMWDRAGSDALRLAAEAAVHANDAAWRAADAAVQILGGAGYVCDHPVEKWMRDTRTLSLIGGSSEGHLMAVAASLLGDETLARDANTLAVLA